MPVIQRSGLRLPGALPEETLRIARAADSRIDRLEAATDLGDRVMSAPDAVFAPLRDPLGGWAAAVAAPDVPRRRSHLEQAGLSALRARGWTAASVSAKDFAAALAELNRTLSPESRGWRRGDVQFGEDALGQIVRLPPVRSIGPTVADAGRALQRPEWPRTARAAVAMSLVLNAHPFTDGNGRTARALANEILFPRAAGGGFVPLYELSRRSEGGYEIALRRAEIHQDWSALTAWLAECLAVCAALEDAGS